MDMIEEEKTKEEFHQRIEDLSDEIFKIIACKRDKNLEERTQLMNSGMIEKEMHNYIDYIANMLEAEINLYYGTQYLLKEFYGAVDGENKDGEVEEGEEEPAFSFADSSVFFLHFT